MKTLTALFDSDLSGRVSELRALEKECTQASARRFNQDSPLIGGAPVADAVAAYGESLKRVHLDRALFSYLKVDGRKRGNSLGGDCIGYQWNQRQNQVDEMDHARLFSNSDAKKRANWALRN
jgi:hypothetical protein